MNTKNFGGHHRFGYKYNKNDNAYEIVPEEAAIIQLIALLVLNGYKINEIVYILDLLRIRRYQNDEEKKIDRLWIRRTFGFYKRYVDNNEESIIEKLIGEENFPAILKKEDYYAVYRMFNNGDCSKDKIKTYNKTISVPENITNRKKKNP